KGKEHIFILLLAVVTFLIYSSSIRAPFIFDDNHLIVENVFIKSAKYFSEFFKGFVTSYPIPKGMCRPLLMLTFGFNYLQGGLSPVGYHIINILFHFLNACLLYFLLKFLNKSVPRGLLFIITLLFVVHPLNTEAVTYISSRSDLMVTFFIISGFFLYLKGKYTLSCLMYVPALLTKETGLVLPLLILGYGFCYRMNGFKSFKKNLGGKNISIYAGLVLITALWVIYRSTIFSSTPSIITRSYYSNILIQSAVTLLYLKLFIFPHPLNILHYISHLNSLGNPLVLISTLVVLSLILLIFIFRKRKPLISLGLIWFLICLLPKFYARLAFPAMEHHFYLPSVGIYIVLAVILNNLYLKRKKYFLYMGAGVISLFSLLTFLRNYEYKDAVLFWKISSQRNPKSAYIHNEVGREYLKRNKLNRAEGKFKKALMFSKRAADTIISKKMLSAVYYHKKNYHQAEKLLNELLKLNPPPPGTYEGLGKIYLEMAKEKEAITFWNKELSLYPQRPSIYVQFGLYYLKKKEFIKAEDFFQKARQKNPDFYLSYYGLGKIWENNKDYDKAIKYYQKALSLNPACAYSHYALGRLYGKMGNFLALGELEKTIELDSNFARAHNDLAVLYASMNPPNWELAKKHIEIAKALGYSVKKTLLKEIGDGELKNR
ncbi:MAG: tetratricopeptide repeat protein, partial [Candidatus Omnitrophica bacterium]|nr:tetratricopeptide repeat protein [Candidatus Omnitrophota bacterium]